MATFLLRSSEIQLARRVSFSSRGLRKNYMKTEEVGNAIVSEPLDFGVLREGLSEPWIGFVEHFNQLLYHNNDLEKLNLIKANGHHGYRIVISSASEANKRDGSDGLPEVVTFLVRIKLISGIPLTEPGAKMEQGCLAQLAKLCGHENMEVVISGVDAMNYPYQTALEMAQMNMSWNKEDLCWETNAYLNFRNSQVFQFGNRRDILSIQVAKVELKMNNTAVARILRRIYGGPGNSWLLQKQILELGQFSDMEITSSSGEGAPIKCHRCKLAVASPVFAKMLEEAPDQHTTSDGPTVAKRGKWKEAETRSVTLPESEDAIKAMLNFVYYEGCEEIFRNRAEIVLELLEAAEKYQIENLKNVVAFVLLTDAEEDNWMTVDAAMKLFHFARRLEGQLWNDLKTRSTEFLQNKTENVLMACADYQELINVASRVGNVFQFMIEATLVYDDNDRSTSLMTERSTHMDFPNIGPDASLHEALAVFDWITCETFLEYLCGMNFGIEIMVLAQYCSQPIPSLVIEKIREFLRNDKFRGYGPDYLVDLFCYCRQKEAAFYDDLKISTVRAMQTMLVEQRDELKKSKKYMEMLHKDPEAFEDFTWLCNMEFAEEIKDRNNGDRESEMN